MGSDLHERLIANQSTEELKRKADKARERKAKLWTREELDYCERRAKELYKALNPHATSRAAATTPLAVCPLTKDRPPV